MSLPAEKLAQVNSLGLSISGLWWAPERIAFHNGQGWKTVPWQKFIPKDPKMQTVAVSPVGTDGLCRFIGWDIDTGDPQHVRAILNALPKGAIPLVSLSGRKGFHIWCFPSQPIPVQTAVAFAKAIREKAGIPCEIFPSSKRSKCLKWPLSVHPEIGKPEVFVHEDDLTTEYDTQALLEALAEGYYRTPREVVEAFVEANAPRKRATKSKPRKILENTSTSSRKSLVTATKQGHWLEVFRDEQVGFRLLEFFGKHTRASRLGQAFRCPVHPERRPSATFTRDSNGLVAFHDWHWEKYGLESEFFTLPELYHAGWSPNYGDYATKDSAFINLLINAL